MPTRGGHDGTEVDEGSDIDDEVPPSRWVKAGTVCAIAFGAVLLACAVIIVTGRHDGPGARHTTPPVGASAPGTTVLTLAPSSGTTATPDTSLAPADVVWRQVGLGALPFSATAGPRQVASGVPGGFAHSQQGALLAAAQILGRLSWAATDTTSMRAVAVAMTTPSAHALAALGYGPPDDPSLIPQLAGFQFLSYSPDAALINLALRFNATLRVVPAALVWSAGDWRLAGAPGPLTQTSWAAVEDLTGYVLFSGRPTTAGH